MPSSAPSSLRSAIGNTPLLRLRRLSEETGCELLAKAELMNPGGSIKDRTALGLIEAAEASGKLRPGGTIVEGTGGNTGIGLTLLGHASGYRVIAVMSRTLSPEKIELLRAIGAEVRLVEPVPYTDPNHYNQVARRLAESTTGGFWADQFDSLANQEIHYRTTAPEIWAQTEGRVTGFVAAIGTGGTLAGVSRYLKERRPDIRIGCPDPPGSAMASWLLTGKAEVSPGESITEGVGQARVTGNVARAVADSAWLVPDAETIAMAHELLRTEGLFVGPSSALNVCGALRMAREGGPGQVIVTILCDGGGRYLSKLYRSGAQGTAPMTPNAIRNAEKPIP